MTKMTYRNALAIAIETVADEEVKAKLEKLSASLEKKSSNGERKPTATQIANEGFKQAILNGMESGTKYTITDLMKSIPELEGLSNQRVSAIVRQLKDCNLLDRDEIKRKAYFSKAE